MILAIIDNTQSPPVIKEINDSSILFPDDPIPNTGVTTQWLEARSAMRVGDQLPYTPNTQGLALVTPYIQDGMVFIVQVQDMDANQRADTDAALKANVKKYACSLLARTDWTEIPTVSTGIPRLVNKLDFDRYRIRLRRLAVFPSSTISGLPNAPIAVWTETPIQPTTSRLP